MNKRFKVWREKIKDHFKEVLKTKSDPHSLALGFAIATFLSILPTPGLSILIGFSLLLIIERMSKISMTLAYLIFNPIITTPLYAFGYKIGNSILSANIPTEVTIEMLNAYSFTLRLLLGNLILGAIIGISSYILIYLILKLNFIKKSKETNLDIKTN